MPSVRIIDHTNIEKLFSEIKRLEIDPSEYDYYIEKNVHLVVKLTHARGAGGNILRQAMLSSGGDCIVKDRGLLPEDLYVSMLLTGSLASFKEAIDKSVGHK